MSWWRKNFWNIIHSFIASNHRNISQLRRAPLDHFSESIQPWRAEGFLIAKKNLETLWLTNSTETNAFASSVDFAGVALPLLAGFLFWCKTVFRGSKHQMTSDDYAKSIKSQASSAAFPVAEPSWMLKGEGLCNCCWKQSTWYGKTCHKSCVMPPLKNKNTQQLHMVPQFLCHADLKP